METADQKSMEAMKQTGIMQADREQLTDISRIRIDTGKPAEERMEEYLRQAGNPFLVRVGDYVVQLEYADTEKGWEDRMTEYVSWMARFDPRKAETGRPEPCDPGNGKEG